MPQTRAIFFFKSERGFGWSSDLDAGNNNLSDAMAKAKLLLPEWINILGRKSFLYRIRVSDDLVKRDSQVYQVPLGDQQSKLRLTGTADIANTCLNVKLKVTDTIRGRVFIRGQPDEVVIDSGFYAPPGYFVNAFAGWKNNIVQNGWFVRYLNQPPPVGTGPPFHAIASLLQNPVTGSIQIVTSTPNEIPAVFPFGQVNITGLPGFPMVRGRRNVFNRIDNATFTIKANRLMPTYLGGGQVQVVSYALGAITDCSVETVTHRNSGRPSDAPVGRRRVR
jgi:hypothetical protein